jgi:hypothetical protein
MDTEPYNNQGAPFGSDPENEESQKVFFNS